VSDIDYLQDLGSFTQTDANFNRALGKSSSPALLRSGTLTYDASIWRSVLELRSFQQLNQLQPNQYELLPRLSVIGNQKFGRIETSGLIQLSEFDRRDNAAATGSRSVIDGSARLPFRSTWGHITPGLRLIHRNYSLDQVTANQRSSASITSTGASIDAGLVFERRTTIRGQRLLQTLEPRFQYLYVDEDFQDDLPSFDSTPLTPSFEGMYRYNRFTGYDRIGDANRIAIGVTTEFSSLASGKRLLSASIGQIFHLRDREVSPGLAPGIDDTADTSPLFFQLTSQMKFLRVAASWELDTQSGRSNRGFLSARYRSPKNVIVNFNYAFTDEAVQRNSQRRNEEETDLSFQWPIGSKTGKWQIVGRWNYGWDDGQTIESLLGVEYNDCCWKARLVFRRNLDEPRLYSLTTPGIAPRFVTDRRADSGIYFEIQLKGLASLGGRLDSLLQDSIPGYLTDRQR
jgi:LPS-assembly protein